MNHFTAQKSNAISGDLDAMQRVRAVGSLVREVFEATPLGIVLRALHEVRLQERRETAVTKQG